MTDPGDGISAEVRRQYEDLPYPPRDPNDEKKWLVPTYLETLPVLNHYCYGGRRDFRDHFRGLIAGGGTGDALIHLAHALRTTNAEVHYIDLSERSKDIARQRARVRGLSNIVWHHGSLLDLPEMHLPKFDYINCCGVLHHLACPEEGLAALRAVLKDDGAMGLMVYGQYGRTGVYQLQELLRRINQGVEDIEQKLANAKAVLAVLPPTNWFKRAEELISDHKDSGDAGIYDLLLHSQDRAYTVPQLHQLLASSGLHLIEYAHLFRRLYRPQTWLRDEKLLTMIAAMPRPEQEAIAELIGGAIFKHMFHAAPRQDTVARIDDPQNVPFFHCYEPSVGPAISQTLQQAGQRKVNVRLSKNHAVELTAGRFTNLFFNHVDGRATMGEILQAIRTETDAGASDEEILAEVRPAYEALNLYDILLLRRRSVWPLPLA
jgi:SAM-dependent methyltransferase